MGSPMKPEGPAMREWRERQGNVEEILSDPRENMIQNPRCQGSKGGRYRSESMDDVTAFAFGSMFGGMFD